MTAASTRHALQLWRDVTAETVRDPSAPDLSARQISIFLTVYLGPPPHTVRGLATGLGLQKPAVTRAIDALSKAGFVKRARDEKDRRNVLVQRTVRGSVYLSDFAEMILARLRAQEE